MNWRWIFWGTALLFVLRGCYCTGNFGGEISELIVADTPQQAQRQVLRRLLHKPCICFGLDVHYKYKENGHLIDVPHAAHYDAGKEELRIEVDLGSGWAFGWDKVTPQTIEKALRQGGEFRHLSADCPYTGTDQKYFEGLY